MSVYCDPLGNCVVTVTGALSSEPPVPLGGGLDYFPPTGPAAQIGTGAAPPAPALTTVVVSAGRPKRGAPSVAAPPPIAAPSPSPAALSPLLAAEIEAGRQITLGEPSLGITPQPFKPKPSLGAILAKEIETGQQVVFSTTPDVLPPLTMPKPVLSPSLIYELETGQQLVLGQPTPPKVVVELPEFVPGLQAPSVPQTFPELAPTGALSEAGQLEMFELPKPSIAPVLAQVADVVDLTFTGGLVRTATTVLGLIGKVFAGPVGLLMQPTEAGVSAAQEAALVEQQLTPGTFPTPPVSGTTGLPDFAVPTVPDVGETVVVSAPRIETPLPFDPSLGFGPQLLGDVPLSGIRGSPAPGSRPAPRPATGVSTPPGILQQLASGLLGETAGPGPSRFPGERPGGRQQLGPLALPGTSPRMAKPPIDTGTEQCQPKQRQQQKKKKQPRKVCYRGTYVELSHGLIKHRREKIPCR